MGEVLKKYMNTVNGYFVFKNIVNDAPERSTELIDELKIRVLTVFTNQNLDCPSKPRHESPLIRGDVLVKKPSMKNIRFESRLVNSEDISIKMLIGYV